MYLVRISRPAQWYVSASPSARTLPRYAASGLRPKNQQIYRPDVAFAPGAAAVVDTSLAGTYAVAGDGGTAAL
jgi:hypothetical protein